LVTALVIGAFFSVMLAKLLWVGVALMALCAVVVAAWLWPEPEPEPEKEATA
jgi:hypothetical protein